jgi:hypothetical protein
MERMTVRLKRDEREALQKCAESECREWREQARLLIIEGLQFRGLLMPGYLDSRIGKVDAQNGVKNAGG